MNADKIKYPFQNTSLVNLSGEVWKAIPDFEGIYKISNYGRIKSLSKRIPMNTPNGGEYTSQEKIRKARLDVKMNKTIKQPLYTLIISLYKDGRSHHFSVARLVYLVFGRKYNLADPTVFISYKDHNGRNTHISNLIKTDISSIKLNSFKEGRAISHLKVLSKPITQFDSKGFPIKSFPSMYEAGKILGLHPGNIAEVVSGRGHMYKGFFWKSGTHNRRLNLKKIERDTPRERIHRNLLKRLKLRKVNLEFPPAFLNLSIESMKGEIWKDVPGYKGLYKISSFGRVKAMQKISQGKQRKWLPEQIQRLTVDFRLDSDGKEVPGSTFVCMAKNGEKRLVSVPRLVYHLFVKRINLTDTTRRVYYKDGNTLNLHYKNLILKKGIWSINKMKSQLQVAG